MEYCETELVKREGNKMISEIIQEVLHDFSTHKRFKSNYLDY